MTATFWEQVTKLEGSTIHSVAQAKAYEVVRVTSTEIELQLHDGKKIRILKRADLEALYRQLVTQRELTTTQIRQFYNFNVPVAAAILTRMEGVSAGGKPYRLTYKRITT